MRIEIKRVYDEPSPQDGFRVLVDRLWPRGMTREAAQIDLWAKQIAPSDPLRRWFGHTPDQFDAFTKRYTAELDDNASAVDDLLGRIDRRKRLTLLYAARDVTHNHAVVLKRYLLRR